MTLKLAAFDVINSHGRAKGHQSSVGSIELRALEEAVKALSSSPPSKHLLIYSDGSRVYLERDEAIAEARLQRARGRTVAVFAEVTVEP